MLVGLSLLHIQSKYGSNNKECTSYPYFILYCFYLCILQKVFFSESEYHCIWMIVLFQKIHFRFNFGVAN